MFTKKCCGSKYFCNDLVNSRRLECAAVNFKCRDLRAHLVDNSPSTEYGIPACVRHSINISVTAKMAVEKHQNENHSMSHTTRDILIINRLSRLFSQCQRKAPNALVVWLEIGIVRSQLDKLFWTGDSQVLFDKTYCFIRVTNIKKLNLKE